MPAKTTGVTLDVTEASRYVPVIDLSDVNTPAGRLLAAEAIGAACESSGFFTIVGHGVGQELIDRMYETTRAFFEQAAEQKAGVEVKPGTNGYYTESGCGCSGETAPPDLNELFVASVRGDDNTLRQDAEAITLPWEAVNQWPDAPDDFRQVWDEYTSAMVDLATNLMRLFALALGLDENFFDARIDKHASTISANYYYPLTTPPLPGQLRKGEHVDWGNMTILYQDGGGGLQVEEKGRGWRDVPYTPGSFVINIGDMMEFWTGGRWVSTMHRVCNPTDANPGARISIPFFHIPNPDTTIEPLLPVSNENIFERITSFPTPADWFRERMAAVFS